MNRFKSHHVRTMVGAAALSAVLAAPSAALAGQGYIVTLQPSADTTCESTITAVSRDYGIVPKTSYTSSMCGFSASIPRRTVEQLKSDPRVLAVNQDGVTMAA